MHGSPYHVYPANNYPAIQAFQAPSSGIQSVSASPLLTSRIHQMVIIKALAIEINNVHLLYCYCL